MASSASTPTAEKIGPQLNHLGTQTTELVAAARALLRSLPKTEATTRQREAAEALIYHARACVNEVTCLSLRQ